MSSILRLRLHSEYTDATFRDLREVQRTCAEEKHFNVMTWQFQIVNEPDNVISMNIYSSGARTDNEWCDMHNLSEYICMYDTKNM